MLQSSPSLLHSSLLTAEELCQRGKGDLTACVVEVSAHSLCMWLMTCSGVATLSDYQSSQHVGGGDDDSEKFFAGGSEHRCGG